MPGVSRQDELKFWRSLTKLFGGLIEDVRKGTGMLNGVSTETRSSCSRMRWIST